METFKKWVPTILALLLLFGLVVAVGLLITNVAYVAKPTSVAPEATSAPTSVPASPTPVPPTATVVPTAVVDPLHKKKIGPCPGKSLGFWTEHFPGGKQTKHELFQKNNPYPGTTVLCEYESYFASEDVTIVIPDGKAAIIADWRVNICGSGVRC